MLDSPYQPGFGARPAVLAGRDQQIATARASLTRVINSGAPAPSALVLTGSRGMGKTVTLDVIGDIARAQGLATATVALDSVSDNPRMIAARVAESLAHLGGPRRGTAWQAVRARLAALSVEVNAGVVKVVSPPAASPSADGPHTSAGSTGERQHLAVLLADGARYAVQRGRAGLVLLVDELQEAPRGDLVVVANALQEAMSARDAPFAVFAAGLPQTPEVVTAAASFTERFDFRVLRSLDDDSAARALLEPAVALRVRWAPEAADAVLTAAAGSPYLIQRLGDEAWSVAGPSPGDVITVEHARQAVVEVHQNLSDGMFRGRWSKATEAERRLLVAIARVVDVDEVALTRDVTLAAGRTTPQLSPARRSLLDKGLVESAGHARLRFSMPGFAEFVRDVADVDWVGPGTAGPSGR